MYAVVGYENGFCSVKVNRYNVTIMELASYPKFSIRTDSLTRWTWPRGTTVVHTRLPRNIKINSYKLLDQNTTNLLAL